MENPNMTNGGGKGKRNVEIKKVQHKLSLIVTFSKRKSGLFKKTKDLTEVCKKEAAVITFSPHQKPYAVGYPSVDSVVETYLHRMGGGVREEEEEEEGLWWESSIEAMNNPEELKNLRDALTKFRGNLEARLEDLRVREEKVTNFLADI